MSSCSRATNRLAVAVLALAAAGCATQPGPRPDAAIVGEPFEPARSAPGPSSGLTAEVLERLLVAEFAGQRGQVDLALDNYLELARRLDDPQIAERATRIALFARRTEAAIEAGERWVALAPDDLEARQILAVVYLHAGRTDDALAQLQRVLAAGDGAPGRRMRMIASLLGRAEDQQRALEVMRRLVATREDDADAWFAYTLLALRAGEDAVARRGLDRLARLGPLNANLALAYVAVLEKDGRRGEALDWLAAVVERQPDNFDLRMVYARLLADAERYEEARAEFRRLAAARPENGDVHYALGLLALQAGDLEAAARAFRRVVELDYRPFDAAFYLGQIAEAQGEVDRALEWFRKVKGGSNRFEAQLHVALLLARKGEVAQAQALLAGLVPEGREQRTRLARARAELLVETGRPEEAMAVLDEAIAVDEDPDLLYARAMLAEQMGRLDLLERDLRRVLELDPDNAHALNALGYTLADRTDRYEEAYRLIKRALELRPDDYYILDSMGWVLYRLGRFEEAVSYLERARAIRDDPEVAAHLAEVLWVMGRREDARAVWEQALRKRPDDERLRALIERLGK